MDEGWTYTYELQTFSQIEIYVKKTSINRVLF